MTFGSTDLLRGINFLVAVIGLFGIRTRCSTPG